MGSAVSFAVSVLSTPKAFAGGRRHSLGVPIHPRQGEFTSPSVPQPAFALICQQSPAEFTDIHNVPGILQLGSVGLELGEPAACRAVPGQRESCRKPRAGAWWGAASVACPRHPNSLCSTSGLLTAASRVRHQHLTSIFGIMYGYVSTCALGSRLILFANPYLYCS